MIPRDLHEKSVQKINRFVYILTDFGIGSLVYIIYIGHYFLPIDYVIFILTKRLVPVDHPVTGTNLYVASSYKIITLLHFGMIVTGTVNNEFTVRQYCSIKDYD